MLAHYLKGDLIAHSPRNNNQVEDQPSRLSLLAPPLTGFHLLNIISVLVFGIWKVVMSGHKGLVVVTKVELVLIMILGLVYAFHSFKWGRGQVCRADGLSDYTTPRCWRNAQKSTQVSTKSIWPLPFGDLFIVLRMSVVSSCLLSRCFGGAC